MHFTRKGFKNAPYLTLNRMLRKHQNWHAEESSAILFRKTVFKLMTCYSDVTSIFLTNNVIGSKGGAMGKTRLPQLLLR